MNRILLDAVKTRSTESQPFIFPGLKVNRLWTIYDTSIVFNEDGSDKGIDLMTLEPKDEEERLLDWNFHKDHLYYFPRALDSGQKVMILMECE